jgi:hypothetical protein
MSEADLRWNPGTMTELVGINAECGLPSWLIPWAVAGVFGGESPSYTVAVWSDLTSVAMSGLAAADPNATWRAVARVFDDRRARSV